MFFFMLLLVLFYFLFCVFWEMLSFWLFFSPSEIILICLIYIYIHPSIRSLVSYMPKNYFYFSSFSLSLSLALFYSFKFNCSMMKKQRYEGMGWDERNFRASYSTIIVKDIIIIIIIIVNLHFYYFLLLLHQSSTHISIEMFINTKKSF